MKAEQCGLLAALIAAGVSTFTGLAFGWSVIVGIAAVGVLASIVFFWQSRGRQ